MNKMQRNESAYEPTFPALLIKLPEPSPSPAMSLVSPMSPDHPYLNSHLNPFSVAASNTCVEDNEVFSDVDGSADDDDSMSEFSAANLLSIMADIQSPRIVLAGEGFRDIHKLCETAQGAVFSATKDNKTYRIKQTNKEMHFRRESAPDAEGVRVLVGDDIIRETMLLHSFSSNAPNASHTIKYVDSVESEYDYYLICEAVGDYTLCEFITKAHRLIREEKMVLENYKEATKRIVKQIAQALAWLHDEQRVCHMNLSPQNILIVGEPFVAGEKGEVTVSEEIEIRVSDFGVSEQFPATSSSFEWSSFWLRERYECTSPQMFEEVAFDARKADMFALGSIVYKMATDTFLCRLPDASDMGFYVLARNKLDAYIEISGLRKYFDAEISALMMRLLCIDEAKRFSARQALQSVLWN